MIIVNNRPVICRCCGYKVTEDSLEDFYSVSERALYKTTTNMIKTDITYDKQNNTILCLKCWEKGGLTEAIKAPRHVVPIDVEIRYVNTNRIQTRKGDCTKRCERGAGKSKPKDE